MGTPGVVVTGVGLVTPAGPTLEETWDRSVRGESGIRAPARFGNGHEGAAACAEVEPFSLDGRLRRPKSEKFMGPSVRYVVRAALDALAASGLDLASVDPYRVALYTASGQTGLEGSDLFAALEVAWTGDEGRDFANLGGRASRLLDRYFSLRTLANAGLGLLSAELGAKGPSDNFVQGDTAPALALGSGLHDLLEGRADVAVVGAYDSLLNVSTFLAYQRAGLLSAQGPAAAHRPFDRERDGLALGEGAAVLVLERGDTARRRGAFVMGELVGVGSAMEVTDSAEAKLCGEAVRAAIAGAAGDSPVDLVVAHGIGTQEGDRREERLVASLLGTEVPVAAFKGLTGYLGAASALVECGLALEALHRRCVPAVAGLRAPDPDCRLNLVLGHPQPLTATVPTALCLSWSWLGQCAAIALRPAA